MSAVRSAVALLTRLPVATSDTAAPGAAAFGVVGAGVGIAAATPLAVLAGGFGEPWLGAIAAVAMSALLTGGLHLDGLGDTADALMARDADAAERARRDPVLGAGGTIAIVLVVAAQIAALVSLVGTSGAMTTSFTLVGVASVARVAPLIVTLGRRRARPATAPLGAWFAELVTPSAVGFAGGSAVIIVPALAIGAASLDAGAGPNPAAVVGVGGLAAAGIGTALAIAIVALRRGLDGDGMGAAVELSVVTGLVAAALAS
jgi:adenosylcobinamide-GDP ribazoletransferase